MGIHARLGVGVVLCSFVALVASASGCSGSSSELVKGGSSSSAEGTEGAACRVTGTGCNGGLVCVAEVCVKMDAGAVSPDGPDGSTPASDAADAVAETTQRDGDRGDGSQCTFKHPLLDGGARFCGAGDCYCEQKDSCYPVAIATSCCPSGALRCS